MALDSQDREELLHVLRALRFSVASLCWEGLENWPRRTMPKAFAAKECDLGSRSGSKQDEPRNPQRLLELARQELGDCTRCRLHQTRTHIVFGEGSPTARLVFVGEGPGSEEDQQGRPFVGRAGRLLDKMIQALGLARSEVYICNMVKCRPPNNRTPNSDEIETCSPFLIKQIEAIQPALICALGACAAQGLLGSTEYISRLRGKVHSWRGIPLIATYHPAYLLRNATQKAAAWQDFREIIRVLAADADKSRNL